MTDNDTIDARRLAMTFKAEAKEQVAKAVEPLELRGVITDAWSPGSFANKLEIDTNLGSVSLSLSSKLPDWIIFALANGIPVKVTIGPTGPRRPGCKTPDMGPSTTATQHPTSQQTPE